MNSTVCSQPFSPGQSSLGYTPPRSSQIRSETHLQGSPSGFNASTGKPAQLPRSIYVGVFLNMSYMASKAHRARRSWREAPRTPICLMKFLGSKAKQRTVLRTIHVKDSFPNIWPLDFPGIVKSTPWQQSADQRNGVHDAMVPLRLSFLKHHFLCFFFFWFPVAACRQRRPQSESNTRL